MKILHRYSKLLKWFLNSKNFKLTLLPCLLSKPESETESPCSTLPTENPNNDITNKELAKVFDHFDTNNDGKISGDELFAYFVSVGEAMSNIEVQSVIEEFDSNGDNLLEFEDFVKLMEREGDGNDDLKRAFEMFEVDKGCGCITPKGLQNMFNRLGDAKSYDECASMIGVFDLDGNGVLDFHEFRKMMVST
ncbi:calcium-binding protein CML41 [Pyrus ussuriensis x Pyrus communis]|uniref:Calcium-binding protein CML41 n=1 Tax=Pyrus ussuriensis x Pyrus communis TaxID=2448454 RepID=A0A5N5HPK1_9ROSA|nr:calcium-binding protein CML41 [Pyrus ussuriensis x Pyrus communis]